MHVTDCGPIAVLFELKVGPLGLHRTVLHYEDLDRIFHGPMRPSDPWERNTDSAYKRRGTVASGNIGNAWVSKWPATRKCFDREAKAVG